MNDRTELYPCGVRVNVPSLGINSNNLKRRMMVKQHMHSDRLVIHRPPSYKRSNTMSDVLMPQIMFSDDIIETMCPETISYSKAREKMRRSWKLGNDRYGSTKKKKGLFGSSSNAAASNTVNGGAGGSFRKPSDKLLKFADKPKTPVFLPVLQPIFPKPLSEWTQGDNANDILQYGGKSHKTLERVSKGSRRWTALPIRAPTPIELQLSIRSLEILEDGENKLCHSQNGEDKDLSHDNNTIKQLSRVFSELMSTWNIFVQPNDLQLIKAMTNMCSPCASQQMYGLENVRQLLIRQTESPLDYNKDDNVSSLNHDKVWEKVECLLGAETERVRVATAILLCCCEDSSNRKITDCLLSSLDSLSYSEKWAATQALAITDTCNIDIITILFNHLCRPVTDSDRERISRLLAKLSSDSTLVVSVLAEKLSSRCWMERHTSCSLLPLLYHPLNKDVSYCLLNCALHDWNPQVRLTAAQTLGRTGNGKLIHDAIKKDLMNKDEITRLNALKRLHLLRLMTATILPVYVQCFKDDHDSVKLEAISIAEDLELIDDDVMSALTLLLQDKCWKVKAHAIRAVGILKVTSEAVISHLLWAARFEQLPVVRTQVCHTLAVLGSKDERIVMALKDLLNVEDDEMVLREARKSLHMLGEDSRAVDDMLDIVCAEVKSLSTKEAITQQIISSEKRQLVEYVMAKQTRNNNEQWPCKK